MKAIRTPVFATLLALAALAPRANAAVVFSEATLNQHPDWVAWWNEQGFLAAFKGETRFTSLLGKNEGVLDPSPRGVIFIIK